VRRQRITSTMLLAALAVLTATAAGAAALSVEPPRPLLSFETTFVEIQIPPDEADLLRDLGFDRLISLIENGDLIQALADTEMVALRTPALAREPAFQLLVAEIYFRLGVPSPELQFTVAKPIYQRLMRRIPRWINQPLVAYRLATIFDRQGYIGDAIAHYGLLVDWYPDDTLADRARLGLVMSSLRAGDYSETETHVNRILDDSRDAQVRYHAVLCLAVSRERQAQFDAAQNEFLSVLNWPEDLTMMEAFELYSLANTFKETGEIPKAREAFLAFLRRFRGSDREPAAVFALAEIARQTANYPEAITGYRYLVEKVPKTRAGVRSMLALAALRLAATGGESDATAEQLLLHAREQFNFFGLQQEAALRLAAYYLHAGRPRVTIVLAGEVFDNPLNVDLAGRAIKLISEAFNGIVSSYRTNPNLVATIFAKYRTYLSAPSVPAGAYDQLAHVLYQNLQPDTLLQLATESPLTERYPDRSLFFAAKAESLRGNDATALEYLERFFQMIPVAKGVKKMAESPAGPPTWMRYDARMLAGELNEKRGRSRDALREVTLALTDASDTMEKGRAELAAGLILLGDRAAAAAADHLAKAIELLGEKAEGEPLATWQGQAGFAYGEALYRAGKAEPAARVFAGVVKSDTAPDRVSMARIRLDQIARAAGNATVAEPESDPAVDLTGFWPATAARLETHLQWVHENESRFGRVPDWEKLP
jgi:TolA-binding protein